MCKIFLHKRRVFLHICIIFFYMCRKMGERRRKFCNLLNIIKEEHIFAHMQNNFALVQKEGRNTKEVLQPSEHYKGGTEGCNLSTTPANPNEGYFCTDKGYI
ncbi:hypothetical protein ACS0TY_013945 [Phlomoides rotata]